MSAHSATLLEYPELYKVDYQPGSFASGLKSQVSFERGQVMTRLTGVTTPTPKTWTSVQRGLGPSDNIELNSVLVYANHSCSPNVAVDLSSPNQSEWHFRALKEISPGDDLTFFYPSTEWDMTQGFECTCQAENCLGRIQGSKYLSREEVEGRGFVSTHVSRLLDERDSGSSAGSSDESA